MKTLPLLVALLAAAPGLALAGSTTTTGAPAVAVSVGVTAGTTMSMGFFPGLPIGAMPVQITGVPVAEPVAVPVEAPVGEPVGEPGPATILVRP